MPRSGRHLARMCAVQALYQWAITGQKASEIEKTFIPNQQLDGKYLDYFQTLIREIPENVDQIDKLISPHINRDMRALDLIEHAVLRVGVYELEYQRDIHPSIIIDEAVDVTKAFASVCPKKRGLLSPVTRSESVWRYPQIPVSLSGSN